MDMFLLVKKKRLRIEIIYYFVSVFSILTITSSHAYAHPSYHKLLELKIIYTIGNIKHFEIAAFSSADDQFSISDSYRYIEIWKKPFKEPLRVLPIQNYNSLSAMQFLNHGNNILIAHGNGTVQIWNDDLSLKETEINFGNNIRHASATKDGRFIAADGEIYDRQKKGMIGRGIAHASYTGLCFGDKSLLLTSGYHDKRIAIRHILTGDFQYREVPHPVAKAALSPNERFVVAATHKGRCYLWRWPEQEPTPLVIMRGDIFSVQFSPDSQWFVVQGRSFVHIFRTDPPEQMVRLLPEVELESLSVGSECLIAMGDADGHVQLYDVCAKQFVGRQKVCANGVGHLALYAKEGLLWAGSCCAANGDGNSGEIALYRIMPLEPSSQADK